MSDECIELKNIKYQTMLLNSNAKVDSEINNTQNLDLILENENIENKKKPWSKLGTSVKIKKINTYIQTYGTTQKLNTKEKADLKLYLQKAIERKKLQRTKDVVYDISIGEIKSIPGLTYDKKKKRFTLRRIDKKNSTLKCLAQKKNHKTKRKKPKDQIKPNKQKIKPNKQKIKPNKQKIKPNKQKIKPNKQKIKPKDN